MTEHAVVYELQSNRSNGNLGLPPAFVQTVEANRIPEESPGFFGPLPQPVIPMSGHGPTHEAPNNFPAWPGVFKVVGMIEVQAAPPVSVPPGPHAGIYTYCSESGEYFWVINGIAFTNSLQPPIAPRATPLGNAGRVSPPDELRFTSDALTALQAAGQPVAAHVHLEYKYPRVNPYQGLIHYLEFAEVPPAIIPDVAKTSSDWSLPEALQDQLTGLATAGASHQLGVVNGTTITAEGCNFAALAPEGAVYIRPEDYGGAAADRIPTDFQNNEASRFRFHPSVFIRRSQYVRGVSAPYADPDAINETNSFGAQVLRIVVVDQAPAESNWLLVIDGVGQVVSITHPVGSDLRRPRDIWNQLWVPLIRGSASVENAVQLNFFVPPGSSSTTSTQVITDRLPFVEYARCLPLQGTDQNQGQPV